MFSGYLRIYCSLYMKDINIYEEIYQLSRELSNLLNLLLDKG